MAKPRLPQGKAEVSGVAVHDPGRFKDRKVQKKARPIGEPYATVTEAQKVAWAKYQHELPWLNSSHRPLLRLACLWTARMDDDEFGVSATQALSSILSKLGATPVDETKVNHASSEEEDPSDEFFGRRTEAYALAVVAGDIVAGPHVRNACRRHLDYLAKGHERGLTFDHAAADYAFRFFEGQLRLSEGQFGGQGVPA